MKRQNERLEEDILRVGEKCKQRSDKIKLLKKRIKKIEEDKRKDQSKMSVVKELEEHIDELIEEKDKLKRSNARLESEIASRSLSKHTSTKPKRTVNSDNKKFNKIDLLAIDFTDSDDGMTDREEGSRMEYMRATKEVYSCSRSEKTDSRVEYEYTRRHRRTNKSPPVPPPRLSRRRKAQRNSPPTSNADSEQLQTTTAIPTTTELRSRFGSFCKQSGFPNSLPKLGWSD